MDPFVLVLAASLLTAPLFGQEQPADDAYDCPDSQVGVYDQRTGEWRCKPKLEKKRNVFSEGEKNPHDPCPEDYWWHYNRQDFCNPVICTTEQNTEELKNLCGKGFHEHLSSSGDWTRPIVCVADYKPENEKTGGKSPRAGGCLLCLFNEKGHYGDQARPWAWQFEKAGGKKKKDKKKREGGGRTAARPRGPAGFNIKALRVRAALAKNRNLVKEYLPKKASCAKGQASVPRSEGGFACIGSGAEARCPSGEKLLPAADPLESTVCSGSEDAGRCPAGAGMLPTGDPSRPEACAPCAPGEESLVIDGRPRCLYNPCSEGLLPVPERGLVERYSCAAPLEKADALDWSRVLDPRRKTPAAAPACGTGEGLSWARGGFRCSACGKGREAVLRGAHPVCGRKGKPPCPEGQVSGPGPDGSASCQPCPQGSSYSADRGTDFPRCLPESALRVVIDAATRLDDKSSVPLLR